jgi:drug/metabolite transporter (DMT)-like permease
MLASALAFTLMTTLVKYLGAAYSPALQTFYRQAAGLVVLIPVILRDPAGAFRTTRPGILIFRSAAGIIGVNLSFYSYQKMGLAEANALSFTRTLWLVPIAALILGEKIGPMRIGATVAGFLGVLVMLQPAAGAQVGWPAAAALASAFLFAFTIAGMKIMTRDHPTMVLMAWSAVLGFVLAAPPALFEWRWPSLGDLALLSAMGVLGLATQGFYIKGMAEGDAAAMAPIDYTRLVFAVVLGYALFNDIPNAVTMAGAAIVIGSTLFITLREIQAGRRTPPVGPDRIERMP